MKNKDILAMADDLLEMLSAHEQQLADGGADFSCLSGCYGRESARFENILAAAMAADGYDRDDIGGLRAKISALLAANERLKDTAARMREGIMTDLAAIRRGRKGIKKYGPDENRQVCRFVHRAA